MPARDSALEVLHSLPLTFYSRPFYRRATRVWNGIGIGFILVITALAFIASSIALHTIAKTSVAQVQNVLAQMPNATMKDHKLSIDRPSPVTIRVFDTAPGDTTPANLVIDTNFASTDTAAIQDYMKKADAVFVVTADKFISQKRNGVEINNLTSLPDGTFTHDKWIGLGQTIGIWAFPSLLLVAALYLVIFNFILAFIGGFIVLLLSLIAGVKLDYPAALRLAASAAIPASIIILALQLPFAVRIIIWLCYAIFGLLAVKSDSTEILPTL